VIVLAIDYSPWGNAIFATAPLPARTWLFIIPLALGMLLPEELRKAVSRKLSDGGL
jgi:sodium/potassium-transporting ATPase subunit alpha